MDCSTAMTSRVDKWMARSAEIRSATVPAGAMISGTELPHGKFADDELGCQNRPGQRIVDGHADQLLLQSLEIGATDRGILICEDQGPDIEEIALQGGWTSLGFPGVCCRIEKRS